MLGGVLTSRLSWRWCFWINLPLGGVTVLVVLFLTGSMTPKGRSSVSSGQTTIRKRLAQFDFLGMAAAIPSIVCCLLALQWGGTVYAWDSTRIVTLFMTSFVLLCVFVGIQLWRGDNATLPPRIMKKRSVGGAVWFSFALGASFFVVVYYVSFIFRHAFSSPF